MPGQTNRIIFYGSLMSAFETIRQLGLASGIKFLGHCQIPGRLYDLGDYPALLPAQQSEDRVYAELYEMTNSQVLKALDAFEDYLPDNEEASLYLRQLIKTDSSEQAWVYIYNKPVIESDYIESGSWMKHLAQKR